MKHRIRAAAILVEDSRILLVHHFNKATGDSFLVPPGGGLEATDVSIFDCARRETFEETGLHVAVSRIVYIREFFERSRNVHHLELFCLADSHTGSITLKHLPSGQPDSDMITESRWIDRAELPGLTVYPDELRHDFWTHYADGFPVTLYLGRQDESPNSALSPALINEVPSLPDTVRWS